MDYATSYRLRPFAQPSAEPTGGVGSPSAVTWLFSEMNREELSAQIDSVRIGTEAQSRARARASASARAKVRARVRVVRRRHRLYRGCVDADAYGEGRGRVTRGLDDAAEEGERHEQRGA
eukprot:scaffold19506_cov68-Phaeocystis_antarctica.AAC.5